MTGPIVPNFDPDFIRELLSDGRRGSPSRLQAERAVRLIVSDRRTPERGRAWSTVAEYLCDGGDLDLSAVDPVNARSIGMCELMLRTIRGPHNDSRRALVEAVRRGNQERLAEWLIDYKADHRRLRDALAEAAR